MFEVSKLSEMLTLPDSLTEELPPEVTREEIRDIKATVQEENKTTPIELMIEGESEDDDLMTILKQYLHDDINVFKNITRDAFVFGLDKDNILSDIAAPGYAVIMGRIPGKGRAALNINGTDANIVYIRTEEKRNVRFEKIVGTFNSLVNSLYIEVYTSLSAYRKDLYRKLFNEDLPEEQIEKLLKRS